MEKSRVSESSNKSAEKLLRAMPASKVLPETCGAGALTIGGRVSCAAVMKGASLSEGSERRGSGLTLQASSFGLCASGFGLWALLRRRTTNNERLAFKDHIRNGKLWGMGNRKRDVPGAKLRCKFCRDAIELDRGTAARLAKYFDVTPAHAAVPACAESLHGRFLGREAGGISFNAVGFRVAVSNFFFGEDATQKALAKTLDGLGNPRHFGDVDPGAHDHGDTLAHAYSRRSPR